MSRLKTTSVAVLFCVGACSVINAPEDLKPVDDGSGAQPSAGTESGGSGNKAGSKNGGSANKAGSVGVQAGEPGVPDAGAGGCVDCGAGGAPPIGRDCTVSATDCASTAPICDATSGECRACKTDKECSTETGKAVCVTAGPGTGRCGACNGNADCAGRMPICGSLNVCRACNADADCDSGVCETNGACAASGEAVYASADKGSMVANCGTMDLPCVSLTMAAAKLTAVRHNLVLAKGTKTFTEAVTLPQIAGLRVIGNGATVNGAGVSAFAIMQNTSVSFDGLVIEGATTMANGGIECDRSSIVVTNSTLQNNLNGILAKECDVAVSSSIFKSNTGNNGNGTGIYSTCSADCNKVMTVLRTRFVDNEFALQFSNQANATIENNLFLRNGYNGYTRVLSLYSKNNRVAYNTFVQNFNNGVYVGIVACVGKCTAVGNIAFNNFPGHPEYASQVFYGSPAMTYNITEYKYDGATNQVGDPKFVDPANGNFTPGPGSIAIDKGDPADTPPLDINGNKRPAGKADIGAFEAQ
jgi:hypothetical protein